MTGTAMTSGDHKARGFEAAARARAAGIHFCLSLVVGVLAAILVFWLWYPWPYSQMSGGRELFTLVVTVDIVLGPLITFAVFNRSKPLGELRRDLTVVVLLQLGGLAYGLSTVYQARPVHLVFEVDRFRVVHAVDVPVDLMDRVPPGIDALPVAGLTLLAVRPFRDAREEADATVVALGGIQLSARPDLWASYDSQQARVLQAARPIASLRARLPQHATAIDEAVRQAGRDASQVVFLPAIARKATAWTVLLDARTAQPLGWLAVDSF